VFGKLLPREYLSPGQVDVNLARGDDSSPPGHISLTPLREPRVLTTNKGKDQEIAIAKSNLGAAANGSILVLLGEQSQDRGGLVENGHRDNARQDSICRGDIVVPLFPSVQWKPGNTVPWRLVLTNYASDEKSRNRDH